MGINLLRAKDTIIAIAIGPNTVNQRMVFLGKLCLKRNKYYLKYFLTFIDVMDALSAHNVLTFFYDDASRY